MRQPERFEQWPVDGKYRTVGDGQREADLTLQGERVDVFGDSGHAAQFITS